MRMRAWLLVADALYQLERACVRRWPDAAELLERAWFWALMQANDHVDYEARR